MRRFLDDEESQSGLQASKRLDGMSMDDYAAVHLPGASRGTIGRAEPEAR